MKKWIGFSSLPLVLLSFSACHSPKDLAKKLSEELQVPVNVPSSVNDDACLQNLVTSLVDEYQALDSSARSVVRTEIQRKYPQGLNFVESQTIPTDATGTYWEVTLGVWTCMQGGSTTMCPYRALGRKAFWDQVVVSGPEPTVQLSKAQDLTIQAQQYLSHATQSSVSLSYWSTDPANAQRQRERFDTWNRAEQVAEFRRVFPEGDQFTQYGDSTVPWVVCADAIPIDELIK